MGNPNFINLNKFTQLNFFEETKLKILKISSGGRHNLVLCSNFKVYSFGDNSQFQCSGSNTFYSSPYEINSLNNLKVLDIYAGYNFSILVSFNELIWCFGDNTNHKIGTDVNLKGSKDPYFSKDLLGLNIGKIFPGINNMAIVLSDYRNNLINTTKYSN